MPAIPSSGAVSLTDLSTEFGGDAPHSMSEYYRNGGRVPDNNSNVPTSGQIKFSDWRGAINQIALNAVNATNLDVSTLFGSDWTSTVPKKLTVGSGVTIGGTGSSAAMIIPSNLAGTLEIYNVGNIIGFGGSANGGAGGTAISNAASGVTVTNLGLLAGGGAGGGQGGTGGNGSSTTTTVSTRNSYPSSTWQWTTGSWSGVGSWTHAGGSTSKSYGGHNFYRGSYAGSIGEAAYYTITGHIVSTVSTSGGAGGSGGIGQGYNQSATSGSGGATGGTNAGTGGSGSDGASYGLAAANGSTGSNGNSTNGSAGLTGGTAGDAVNGTSITLNNAGTVAGSVA